MNSLSEVGGVSILVQIVHQRAAILPSTCPEWLDTMCTLLRFPLHVSPWEQREWTAVSIFVQIVHPLTRKPVGAEGVGGSLYTCADCPCSSESILCLTCSEWLDAMCLLRLPLHVNPWEQREQRKGFSPVCWSMWEVTWPGERNIFPHCGHG